MVQEILMVGVSTGRVKDSWIHSAEDLLLQEANDQLSDPTEYTAQIQVSGQDRVKDRVRVGFRVGVRDSSSCMHWFDQTQVHILEGWVEQKHLVLLDSSTSFCWPMRGPWQRKSGMSTWTPWARFTVATSSRTAADCSKCRSVVTSAASALKSSGAFHLLSLG